MLIKMKIVFNIKFIALIWNINKFSEHIKFLATA